MNDPVFRGKSAFDPKVLERLASQVSDWEKGDVAKFVARGFQERLRNFRKRAGAGISGAECQKAGLRPKIFSIKLEITELHQRE